jgi:hypothetical protein
MASTAQDPNAPPKVTVVALQGDHKPQPLDNTKYAQGSPKFSPDGHWLAYCSNESGTAQVYVQAFPGPGAKIQVSNDGGTDSVWRGMAASFSTTMATVCCRSRFLPVPLLLPAGLRNYGRVTTPTA